LHRGFAPENHRGLILKTAQTNQALPATEPATALEMALQRRAGLTDEAERLAAVLARLQTEAAAGASLHNELAKLSETETTEMKCWAAGGCEGSPPKGKQAERQAIAVKMAGTSAVAAAALSAIHDVEHQARENRERIAAADQLVESAALDAMQAELADIRSEHMAAIEQARKSSVKIFGLCSFLSNEGRRLIDRGDHEAGKRYFARAEAMTAIKLPQPSLSHGEIIRAAGDWSRRAATLRSGA
jgi:hypothetical protein